jgi:alanine racemase
MLLGDRIEANHGVRLPRMRYSLGMNPIVNFAQQASWLTIDAGAFAHNARVYREILGAGVRLGAVLKGNAYGHGFEQLLPVALQSCDCIYVIDPYDALAVRAASKDKQVLVLGAVSADEAVELARAGVDVTLSGTGDERILPALRKAGVRLRAQIHVDTGLSREGFMLDELPAPWLSDPALEVRGLLSHFANTEDVTEQDYAAFQLANFAEAALRLGLAPDKYERHIAASAAAMLLPAARHSAVRVGIAMYGLWPSSETRLSARAVLGKVPELRPVLSWRCKSQLTKWVPAGSYVGYGCTYRTTSRTKIAVLPVGYFDGYPRLASGKAHALVNGQRAPLLGRVMMNHVVIDVTRAAPDAAEVTATLIGRDGHEALSADQLAAWAQTINYEIVTRLGAHLRREVVTG